MRQRDSTAWYEVFTSEKSFTGPVLGSYRLNRAGLHVARLAAADAAFGARRRFTRAPFSDALTRDGVLVLPDFAPASVFASMRAEVRAALADAEARVPHPAAKTRGFGPKLPFEGGFDRHDGGALNRFLNLGTPDLRHTTAFVRDSLAPFCATAAGLRPDATKYAVQELVHFPGDADLQKDTHRDTFQPALKAWFFLEDVREEDGPFVYVRGSHRLTRRRAAWEYARSLAGCRPDAPYRGGSFRVSDEELDAMGYPAAETFPVSANTLLVANVRGFHRRGPVTRERARRVAIHGSLRPSAFVPVPYR